MWVRLDKNKIVEDACFSFGGMAATTACAHSSADYLRGRAWDAATLKEVYTKLHKDFSLGPNTPGGMEAFRMTLAASFFFKFSRSVNVHLLKDLTSALPDQPRPLSLGSQTYQTPALRSVAVGKATNHSNAYLHTTGEAKYTVSTLHPLSPCGSLLPSFSFFLLDPLSWPAFAVPFLYGFVTSYLLSPICQGDISVPPNTLYGALVLANKAHARIISIDPSEALAMPGVQKFVSHADVPGSNRCGDIIEDEELFATSIARHCGEALGLVLADSHALARLAASKVKVELEELPAVLSIEQAIKAHSFQTLGANHGFVHGDAPAALRACDVIVEGECCVGGQEHFYLETQNCLVVPKETNELLIVSSTQNCTLTQEWAASACGIHASRVVAKVLPSQPKTRSTPPSRPCHIPS